jgi:hypothetical protein
MAATGRFSRVDGGVRTGPLRMVESVVDATDFPDRLDDPLQAALAERLLAIAATASQTAARLYDATCGFDDFAGFR